MKYNGFLHHEERIKPKFLQSGTSHSALHASPKLKSSGFSKLCDLVSMYILLYHEYLKKLIYRDDSWLWNKDCNFIILFRTCKFVDIAALKFSNFFPVSSNLVYGMCQTSSLSVGLEFSKFLLYSINTLIFSFTISPVFSSTLFIFK